jgi:methylphosphotriester-DNA--protein-cysteine methyltransferase
MSLSITLITPVTFVSQPNVATVQAKTTYVYVTDTGKKYHKKKCGNGNYHKTTLKEAKESGLKPCKKCYGK